ncbi:MAG: VPLPA-CTERM sorting domain-containing protein [Paracoccaceae bacterium]
MLGVPKNKYAFALVGGLAFLGTPALSASFNLFGGDIAVNPGNAAEATVSGSVGSTITIIAEIFAQDTVMALTLFGNGVGIDEGANGGGESGTIDAAVGAANDEVLLIVSPVPRTLVSIDFSEFTASGFGSDGFSLLSGNLGDTIDELTTLASNTNVTDGGQDVFDTQTGLGFQPTAQVFGIRAQNSAGIDDAFRVTSINLADLPPSGGNDEIIPLPAGGWLLLTALAGLALRARRA